MDRKMDQEKEVQVKLKITARHALSKFMAMVSRILPLTEEISSCKTNINSPLIMDKKVWGKTLKAKAQVSMNTVLMVPTTILIINGRLISSELNSYQSEKKITN
jgi:hypothetical protein